MPITSEPVPAEPMPAEPITFEPIPSASTWEEWRALRPLVLDRFRRIYGRTPDLPVGADVRLLTTFELPGGIGSCTQSAVTLRHEGRAWTFTVAAFVPAGTPRAAFLGLNFRGNHAVFADPRMVISRPGDGTGEPLHYENAEFTPPAARGELAGRWPIETIVGEGYAVVTACYLQCGPDTRGVFTTGPHALLGLDPTMDGRPWGAIGIWAWTLSRILDQIVAGTLPGLDPTPTFAFGHSRLGKTALWASAQDERFAGAISNNSGAMGAALSRQVGETPLLLADVRPYWFTPEFVGAATTGRPLPADQWQLLALTAPRLLLVGSAADDHPADPEGERLATARASQLWELVPHGHEVPPPSHWTSLPDSVGDVRAPRHHVRAGGHDVLDEDWAHYLRGVGRHLGG